MVVGGDGDDGEMYIRLNPLTLTSFSLSLSLSLTHSVSQHKTKMSFQSIFMRHVHCYRLHFALLAAAVVAKADRWHWIIKFDEQPKPINFISPRSDEERRRKKNRLALLAEWRKMLRRYINKCNKSKASQNDENPGGEGAPRNVK